MLVRLEENFNGSLQINSGQVESRSAGEPSNRGRSYFLFVYFDIFVLILPTGSYVCWTRLYDTGRDTGC
jgi:hypothetical protein